MSHINCFKCMGWLCLCAHEANILSPQTYHKILNAMSQYGQQSKVLCSQTTPCKQQLLNKCVAMQKVVRGKAPQYLKDLMFLSERLHVHGNKRLLPRTRTDIFKTSFSFSGSLALNSLFHHFIILMEVKTFKRKAFHALTKPP